MKVLICGARAWLYSDKIEEKLDEIHAKTPITSVVVGGAHGADLMAETWARSRGIHGVIIRPDWQRYGKSAGFKRNIEMLDEKPDLIIAFKAGASRGTMHTVEHARQRGIPVQVIEAFESGHIWVHERK